MNDLDYTGPKPLHPIITFGAIVLLGLFGGFVVVIMQPVFEYIWNAVRAAFE